MTRDRPPRLTHAHSEEFDSVRAGSRKRWPAFRAFRVLRSSRVKLPQLAAGLRHSREQFAAFPELAMRAVGDIAGDLKRLVGAFGDKVDALCRACFRVGNHQKIGGHVRLLADSLATSKFTTG